jgi:hypothetical protein
MKIVGKYERDQNFTTVYSGNAMYTIARATGEWARCLVGEQTASGRTLTKETYDKWESQCEHIGEFTLA